MSKFFLICRTTVLVAAVLSVLSPVSAVAAEAGFTGMQVQGITESIAATLGLDKAKGVLVRDVDLGSPADKAGLRRGDLIIKFAGQEIDTFNRLISAVGGVKPGEAAAVSVLRNGSTLEMKLLTIKRPQSRRIAKGAFATIPEAGLTLAALTEKVRKGFGLRWSSTGVVITLIDKEKTKGTDLQRGEVITQVNQQDVWDPRQVVAKFQEAKSKGQKSMLLLVEGKEGERNGFRFSVLPVE